MQITLFGGGGFIGRHLAAELARRGHSLSIPVRNRERVKQSLILLPNTDVYAYDPNAMSGLKRGLAGADVIVNLVGILNEGGRQLFDRVHGEYTRMLIDGCVKNQVPRIVHLSAIGAAPSAASAYLRSKAKAEQIVKACDSVSHVIVRPSVVFGPGDRFVNLFAPMLSLPLLPLPMAAARFQPIYIADLVTMLADVLEDDACHNRVLHAGGPTVLELEGIIRRIGAAHGKSPRLLPLGTMVSYALAAVAEKMPFVDLITRDNCLSMRQPSVCPSNGNDAADIVGALTTFENGLAAMQARRDDYGAMRYSAGR